MEAEQIPLEYRGRVAGPSAALELHTHIQTLRVW